MKTSYIAPPTGNLDITIVRDKEPYCLITLDLGIPNFTVFSLKMPVVPAEPKAMAGLLAEALSALLDEMSAFMLAMHFEEKIIVQIYATVLATFKEMTPDSTTDAGLSPVAQDDSIVTYEGTFPIPINFVNETYDKVVTAANVIKRMPKQRHVELTTMKPERTTTQDVGRLIRQYRGRSIKTQPKPMYVVVYDMTGRPAGTVPIGQNFKNNLLKMMRHSAVKPPEYSAAVHVDRDVELKYTNAAGIPRGIWIKQEQYVPQAFCGDDMALYLNQTYSGFQGGKHWLVKFPDGRVVPFADRPSIRHLKNRNYPVPAGYYRWTLIQEDEPEESISPSDDNSGGGGI